MMLIDYSRDELGKFVSLDQIEKGSKLYDFAITEREKMIENLANFDEKLADLYLEEDIDKISALDIDRAISKAALSMKAIPLFCGSALKNKGI